MKLVPQVRTVAHELLRAMLVKGQQPRKMLVAYNQSVAAELARRVAR